MLPIAFETPRTAQRSTYSICEGGAEISFWGSPVVKAPMDASMMAMLSLAPTEEPASRPTMIGAAAAVHMQLKRLSFCRQRA